MSSAETGTENTEPDNINVGLVSTVTVVGAILVLSIALALTALVRSESSRYGVEVGGFANKGTVARMKEEQLGKLAAAPAWVDQGAGRVSMPIDRAKELVVAEIAKDPNLATMSPPAPPVEAQPAPAEGAAAPAEGAAAPAAPSKN